MNAPSHGPSLGAGAARFDLMRDMMVRARDGDGRAMAELLRGLSPGLRSYIRRQLAKSGRAEPADTEDLLQTTLLAIHAKQQTYDASQPLSGWVYVNARYKVVDHLRATQNRWLDASIDDVAPAESSRDLSTVLAIPPARTRSLIEAVKLEGMTFQRGGRGRRHGREGSRR